MSPMERLWMHVAYGKALDDVAYGEALDACRLWRGSG